jgi:hypothetical protein
MMGRGETSPHYFTAIVGGGIAYGDHKVTGEVRYQRWLSTPTQLVMGNKVDIADVAKDTLTVAIGPREHFQISKGMFLRPGIAYARALDKPLSDASYNVIQVDVPLYFQASETDARDRRRSRGRRCRSRRDDPSRGTRR